MERRVVERLLQISAAQHGLFSGAQARAVGVSESALRRARERGWLRAVRRDIYAFAGHSPSRWESILASSLAGGAAAIISHGAAAEIHGFWGVTGSGPELTLPRSTGRKMAGVRTHHSDEIHPDDVVQRCGVHVTSPVRTLIDLAPSTSDYLLPRMIDEGTIARLWTAERLVLRLDQFRGARRGTRRLRRLLEARLDEASADSPLEQRVIRLLKRSLPAFRVHYRIELAGRIIELDVAWPEYLVAAEIDGLQVRAGSRTKFDSDRLRSNLLESCGWRVVHLTSTMDELTLLAQLVPFLPEELIDWRVRADIAGASRRG